MYLPWLFFGNRIMFYMDVRYGSGETGTTDLKLTESYFYSTSQSLFGPLSVLLSWHKSDPVTAAELARNSE